MLSHNNFSPVIVDVGDGEALKKLILAAKQGDKESFSLVYKSLYTPLYRYVISKCHDEELANDTVSQTFLKFYEALENYEPEKSPLAYLFTIAKRLLINHAEKKTFESLDETFVDGYEDTSNNTIDEAHLNHLSSVINTYIPSLSADEQEVVRLFFYAELSHKEIAEVLQKEEAAIRKIKERALKSFASLLIISMKKNNEQFHIEKALSMYKENVSPSETYLQAILSQIPEQQKLKEGRAVRSPYRWLAVSQFVTLSAIIIAVLPTYLLNDGAQANPYYQTDKEVEAFERQIDQEDYEQSLRDYML